VRSSALHRIAAGLVAAFFLFGGAEHWFGLDPCPHHEAAVVGADGEAGSSGHHAHHSGSSEASEPGSEEHGPCSCVGTCAAPPATALPVASTYAATVGIEHVEILASRAPELVAPQFVPFLLPYAHAPPSLG
jgi:hypothetical protein